MCVCERQTDRQIDRQIDRQRGSRYPLWPFLMTSLSGDRLSFIVVIAASTGEAGWHGEPGWQGNLPGGVTQLCLPKSHSWQPYTHTHTLSLILAGSRTGQEAGRY